MTTEQEQRLRILEEARSWIGTPYHHNQHIKGLACDCIWLLIECFKAVKPQLEIAEPGNYSHDWFLHRDEERYLAGVAQYARPLPAGVLPKPADVAMYKIGRCVSHGGIIVDDEHIIHAYRKDRKVTLGLRREPNLENYFHSYWTAF